MNAVQQPSSSDELIQRMTQIILENLNNEQFGVNELAEQVGMNRSHLYRKVLVLTKKSLSQFIREIRLSEALKILQEEGVTVSEAAYRVGFSHPSYFNSCFHDRYGYPPGEAKHINLVKKSGYEKKGKSVSAHRDSFTRKYALPGILILLLIVSTSTLFFLVRDKDRIEDKSIAVLPFINDSDNDSTTYVINGIMDEILINLQTIKEFRVPGRTSVEQYRNPTKNSVEIAEELGVRYILEGSGQKFGNTLVLRVQLLDGVTGMHIWGTSIEKEIKHVASIIDIQSAIAESIALKLEAVITLEEKQLMEIIPTPSLTAYDFYLRGREEHVKFWLNQDNKELLERPEDLYYKALKYDSSFALAYNGLALVYWNRHYYDEYLSKNFLDSVRILADKALKFDPQLAEAYVTKGNYYRRNGAKGKAMNEYDKAIKLNPNYWEAYWRKAWLYRLDDYVMTIDNYLKAAALNRGPLLPSIYREIGRRYSHVGFPEKAIFYAKEALKLDDDSAAFYNILASIEDGRFNFEKAIEFYKKSRSIDSTKMENLRMIGHNHLYLDQFTESLDYFIKYEKIKKSLDQPVLLWSMPKIGYAYYVNGFKEEGESYFKSVLEISNQLNELDRNHHQTTRFYNPASVYAFLGEKDKAYAYFDSAKTRTYGRITYFKDLKYNPIFDGIRNDPEFQEIFRDVEANRQAQHEQVRQWLEENDML